MTVEVILETPLAQALNTVIQPKLIEIGWSAGDDATALSEYIILMLVNGKNQKQIASELAGDLLQLGPDDPGAQEFSQWLFEQIEVLDSELNGRTKGTPQNDGLRQVDQMQPTQTRDTVMRDLHDNGTHVPTGPKSMRNGTLRGAGRDKRIMNHIFKAMDRSQDSVLHRVRSQVGNERIGRGTPSGPRQQIGVTGRGNLRTQNNRLNSIQGSKGTFNTHGGSVSNIMNMGPQQQLELYAMLEKQSRMMAQLLEAQGQMTGGGPLNILGGDFTYQKPQNGKSLFERTEHKPRMGTTSVQKGRASSFHNHTTVNNIASDMEVQIAKEKREIDPENTTCKYNLNCTNKDCKFAHQSSAAPPGTNIDHKDTCSFGAACKNRKCTGKHPSPAQKIAHQTELDCKFFPNCTNPRCPFKHPVMPFCRNGAECITDECKYTHTKIACKFNPCLNPICTFKHVEGQKRGKFEDKVWIAETTKEHVSERKFVQDDQPEEFIVSETSDRAGLSQLKTQVST